MANQVYSNKPHILYNFLRLQHYRAFSVTEDKDGKIVSITSAVPLEGYEVDPEIGEKVNIMISIHDKDLEFYVVDNFDCMVSEKKVSGSVDKNVYQILVLKKVEK